MRPQEVKKFSRESEAPAELFWAAAQRPQAKRGEFFRCNHGTRLNIVRWVKDRSLHPCSGFAIRARESPSVLRVSVFGVAGEGDSRVLKRGRSLCCAVRSKAEPRNEQAGASEQCVPRQSPGTSNAGASVQCVPRQSLGTSKPEPWNENIRGARRRGC